MKMPRSFLFLLRPVDPLFYPLLTAISFLWVLVFLSDYDHTWAHPEMACFQIPTVMHNGPSFSPADLLRVFQVKGFDADGRSRFFSYFIQILNLKFSVWLYRFIPPHPSISLIWPVNLILTPLLFYRLIRLIGTSRDAPWIGTALLLLSTGYLSGLTMLFHLAKPLALFLTVAAFYLAARITGALERREKLQAWISRNSACSAAAIGPVPLPAGVGRFGALRAMLSGYSRIRERTGEQKRLDSRVTVWSAILLLVIFLAYFTDETAWFIPIALPVLFPRLFAARPGRGWFLLGYFASVAVFLAFVTWAAPRIVNALSGDKGYNFWGLAMGEGEAALWRRFEWQSLWYNTRFLVGSQLAVFWRPSPGFLQDANGCWLLGIISYLGLSFFFLPRRRRMAAVRLLAATGLFLLFQTLVLSRHQKVAPSSYYYANLFSVFLAIALSLLLSGEKEPFATLNRVLVPALLAIGAVNFSALNRDYMIQHEREGYGFAGRFPQETAQMQGKHLTYAAVRRLWDKRFDSAAKAELTVRLPPRALVLVKEIALLGPPPTPPPPETPMTAVKGKPNLLDLPGISLSASSSTAPEWRDSIRDGESSTIWHVAMDKLEEAAWIMVDFNVKPRAVRALAVLPRQDVPTQFPRRATLLASDSREDWNLVSPIYRDSPPPPGEWCVWTFPNDRAYRYYKLSINEGLAMVPYSLAELGLYE